MMDVIHEAGEMGLYTLADETSKKCKAIASRAPVREAVKANVEGLPGVVLKEERAGKITVKYEAVKL